MDIQTLIDRNRAWAASMEKEHPGYFQGLSEVQSPQYLWIGCSDSRVPANEIVGMKPGELFVHRNIANIVPNADVNCLSVIEYAVNALKVKHILVVGHLGCGGVRAALSRKAHGPIDNWLARIKDIASLHADALDALPDDEARVDMMCRLNVKSQVLNVARTSIVQDAWRRGQPLQVHGWCYGLETGLVEDLNCTMVGAHALPETYRLDFEEDAPKAAPSKGAK